MAQAQVAAQALVVAQAQVAAQALVVARAQVAAQALVVARAQVVDRAQVAAQALDPEVVRGWGPVYVFPRLWLSSCRRYQGPIPYLPTASASRKSHIE